MRRRKKGKRDEAQASLDAFTQPAAPAAPAQPPREPSVPSMPDLDVLTKADELIRQEEQAAAGTIMAEDAPLPSFDMPSMHQQRPAAPAPSTASFHDLGKRYPHPAIPIEDGGLVLHRATLNDMTGCGVLMDWVSDGHAVIVEMNRLMKRTVEFNAAIGHLTQFIKGDLGGEILKMTSTRLLLLPPGCRGVNGVEMEAFAVEPGNFNEVGL
jgi:hypothetical protein